MIHLTKLFSIAGLLIAMASSSGAEPIRGSIQVDGAEIHYAVSGDEDGAPLFLIHGSFGGGDDMLAWAEAFGSDRPVVTLDLRGHARSSDTDLPFTYERLSDDVAAVAGHLGFETIDVMGYSLGGVVSLYLASRHDDLVEHLIVMSAPYATEGWHDEVMQTVAALSPDMFRGTPIEANYLRLAPNPDNFDQMIARVAAAYTLSERLSEDDIAAITARTMIVVGDADAVRLDHVAEFFRLRGGWDRHAALMGFSQEVPQARLLVLPGATHIGILSMADTIIEEVTVFLDDEIYALPTWN